MWNFSSSRSLITSRIEALLTDAVHTSRESCVDASLLNEDEVSQAQLAVRELISLANEDEKRSRNVRYPKTHTGAIQSRLLSPNRNAFLF
jgi:hypothetical protein